MKIDMTHGSGGRQTERFIREVFVKAFGNPVLDRMEDAAVLRVKENIAFTTDSFVVTPLFFSGGDIGKLAICGTVNDLLMMGARPRYLSAGFILEEGAETETVERAVESMRRAAEEADVQIVAGDTKVVEGKSGLYINTAGIGEVIKPGIGVSACRPGDVLLLSGNLGEHHAAILSERMGIENTIASDCAPLCGMVFRLLEEGIDVRCMRDVTRGGLATVLNEIAESAGCGAVIEEAALPVSAAVSGFCDILGLDPLYMANEGKMLAVLPAEQAKRALTIVKASRYGADARLIGAMTEEKGVRMTTLLGGIRMVDMLYGEGLPRIC